ncbi:MULTISPECIES: hypothetical protein [Pantoea]|uniref:hypothetical protein n=1 Tax=Pantoea TaxID=53335 RepID=UPI0025953491|nr:MULTISPECIES: hypothetical protein [Pantoea]
MKELNELIDRYDVSCHCGAVYVRPKQDGHLVMYSDYASLAQRAEAAEAALEEEKRINSKLREDRAGLARECNDLEAKLAELNKQEPVAYTDAEELESMRKATYADMFTPNDYYKADHQWIPLFTRPVPAVSLSDLVPHIGSSQVNDAAWVLHDRLGEYGALTGGQFNNIKGCFYDALKVCMGVKP